ncbi:aldose epimerase family protein [Halobacillus sp. Marseille-Q1614]|uniref:aldose epimerase family protein n=1 Tax=Halobacillus sp. Marseille-Q1614 TaxID=2709134 RepID=UPI0020C384B3|nr:aldose epimerase family protein [Halobacillus sp. Marseille-Q1614]
MSIYEESTNPKLGRSKMNLEVIKLGDGWKHYHLKNEKGMEVSILNYGGIITRLLAPDRHGQLENIVLGYKDLKDYKSDSNFFGALIGRVAGRIEKSSFQWEGKNYLLEANDGANHLHGGSQGFHQVLWNAEPFQTSKSVGLVLSQRFLAEQDGYPGNLTVRITYSLTNDNQLVIDYQAKSDQTTPLTLTNHSYFNLSGRLKRTVHNHVVTMKSERYVELDEQLIPTGKILNAEQSSFDFRRGRKLKEGISSEDKQNLIAGGGYDHYFIFQEAEEEVIVVTEKESGRRLTIHTDQPGVVMYSGNQMSDELELSEGSSKKHLGVCFETQASPASLHHEGFPSVELKADQPYAKQTIFTFDTF